MTEEGRASGGVGLKSVSLAEINSGAALEARKDRKYIVPSAALEELIAAHRDDLRVLTMGGAQTFEYESVYFDTPGLVSYLLAAHSRPNRFKVRTRTYVDSGECMLEVKNRDRTGMTRKFRMPYPAEDHSELTSEAMVFLGKFKEVQPIRSTLRRTLTTHYRRTTLLEVSSASRITIDTDLECVTPDGKRFVVPGLVLLETKTRGAPCSADRWLWAAHFRPKKFSKYCTSLAALYPDLPANKWNRVLKEHFSAMNGSSTRPAMHTRVSASSEPADVSEPFAYVRAGS